MSKNPGDATYRWTHQGTCNARPASFTRASSTRLCRAALDDAESAVAHSINCGHLAQTLTHLDARAIHAAGFEASGDWSEHARDYCPSSGLAIDRIMTAMFDAGVSTDDLVHLERSSDPRVLRRLGAGELDFRDRDDVVRYLRAWAELS